MRNEPVLTAQAVTAVISALLVMAVSLGWVTLDTTQQAAVMAFVVAAVNIGAGLLARSRVTPIANPKAADGTPLIKQSDYPQ